MLRKPEMSLRTVDAKKTGTQVQSTKSMDAGNKESITSPMGGLS